MPILQLLVFFLTFISNLCALVFCLHICVRVSDQIHCNWNYRQLGAALWVLGVENGHTMAV